MISFAITWRLLEDYQGDALSWVDPDPEPLLRPYFDRLIASLPGSPEPHSFHLYYDGKQSSQLYEEAFAPFVEETHIWQGVFLCRAPSLDSYRLVCDLCEAYILLALPPLLRELDSRARGGSFSFSHPIVREVTL